MTINVIPEDYKPFEYVSHWIPTKGEKLVVPREILTKKWNQEKPILEDFVSLTIREVRHRLTFDYHGNSLEVIILYTKDNNTI